MTGGVRGSTSDVQGAGMDGRHGPSPVRRAGPPLPASRATSTFLLSQSVAALAAAVSAAGLWWSTALYGSDQAAFGVGASTAGVVVPGFGAHDAFNLLVAVPVLLLTSWSAHRGSLVGLLLWPGALLYATYTYALYAVGAPFGPLFAPHVLLVVLSACTAAGLLAGIDQERVRVRLDRSVPRRFVGGLLVAFGLLTLGQDAGGALATALGGSGAVDPLARHVWTVDLVLEVPALLVAGALLWRRSALGYAMAAGLLLQFGMTPTALAAITALQPLLTGRAADWGSVVGLLVFSAAAAGPLWFFARGTGDAGLSRLRPRAAELVEATTTRVQEGLP